MLNDTGWSFATFGLALAIQNLAWGIGQPVFGALADRFGVWRVLSLGGLTYAAGLYIMGTADSPAWLYLGGGVLIGTGVSAGSFGIVFSVFARNVPHEMRTFVFGLGTAAASSGTFLFAPLSVALIDSFGWSNALIILSVVMLIIPVLAIPLFGNAASSPQSTPEFDQSLRQAMQEAFSHKSYLLLISGFFVCGFHVAFITAHFPAYIDDIGIATRYAAIAIGLIGLFNIFGSLASGVIGQKYSKPVFLTLIYLGRSIAIFAFLVLPQTPASVMIFAAVIGLLWLSTVPPTNGLVAGMFGTRHLGFLSGVVFFSHQIGAFLGVYAGGYLRDLYGSFEIVWWIAVGLGLFAAAIHWPIKEAPVDRGLAASNGSA